MKYYILKKDGDNIKILEIIAAQNIKEAKKIAVEKYTYVIMEGNQLLVMVESKYKKLYNTRR